MLKCLQQIFLLFKQLCKHVWSSEGIIKLCNYIPEWNWCCCKVTTILKQSIHSIQLQKEQFFQQKKTENKNSEEIWTSILKCEKLHQISSSSFLHSQTFLPLQAVVARSSVTWYWNKLSELTCANTLSNISAKYPIRI